MSAEVSANVCKSQLADVIESAVATATVFMSSHKLRPSNDADVAMVCLYMTIIESSKACIVLARQGCDFSVPPVARAAFEAFIDLMNLDRNPQNALGLEVKRMQQKKSAIKAALKLHKGQTGPTGEKLFHLAIEEANNFLRSLPPESKKLEDRSELIRRADSSGVFDMLYVSLCDWSHNNTNVLRERHLLETEAGERFAFFQPLEVTLFESIFTTLIIFLYTGIAPLLRIGSCDPNERSLVSSSFEAYWIESNRLLAVGRNERTIRK